MFSRVLKTILSLSLMAVLVSPSFFSSAQTTPQEEKAVLEKELKELETKIAQYDKDITKTQQEKTSLQNQINLLRKKVNKLDLQIYQSNVMIKDVSLQIKDTESSIEKTSLKIDDSRENLSDILQLIYEEDQRSLAEILIAEPKLSDFFDNLMALEALNYKSQELLNNIKTLKVDLGEQKESLGEDKDDLEKIAKMQLLQKQESEKEKKNQEYFLKLTESQYQQYLKEKAEIEKRAAEIRARIFELAGVRAAPTFGEALDIAKYAAGITGIRPAFLLAILQQESAIGKNVGQCYLKNINTGAGIRISTGAAEINIMKPSRDITPFLTITGELGKDPYNTAVSCRIASVGGYGGAMGPAQFIPSTWMLYRGRLSGILGKAADPWNIRDSFLASALYLSDYGATTKTRDGEWQAAMIYFSGSTKNKSFSWYANNVLAIADGFEKDIAVIEKSQ